MSLPKIKDLVHNLNPKMSHLLSVSYMHHLHLYCICASLENPNSLTHSFKVCAHLSESSLKFTRVTHKPKDFQN